jgi:ankyrin repeat protein
MDIDRELAMAVKQRNFLAVELCLKGGADIHFNSDDAIQWAVILGYKDIVELLLKHGADIHNYCKDVEYNQSAFEYALRNKEKSEIYNILLNHDRKQKLKATENV